MARLRHPQPRPNPTPIRRPDNRVSAPPGNINQQREPKPAAPEASRSGQGKGPRRGVIRICKNICLQMKPCVARRGQHRLRGISDVARRCPGAHFAFRTARPAGPGPGCCLVSTRLQRVQWKTNSPGCTPIRGIVRTRCIGPLHCRQDGVSSSSADTTWEWTGLLYCSARPSRKSLSAFSPASLAANSVLKPPP